MSKTFQLSLAPQKLWRPSTLGRFFSKGRNSASSTSTWVKRYILKWSRQSWMMSGAMEATWPDRRRSRSTVQPRQTRRPQPDRNGCSDGTKRAARLQAGQATRAERCQRLRLNSGTRARGEPWQIKLVRGGCWLIRITRVIGDNHFDRCPSAVGKAAAT